MTKNNTKTNAELIQFLDDRSPSLIMWETADDDPKALTILMGYQAGNGKPRIISLYTELTSLQNVSRESVKDFVICAESVITAFERCLGDTD